MKAFAHLRQFHINHKGLFAALVPFTYSILCVVIFAVLYKITDVNKNFDISPDVEKHPWISSFYNSVMAQSNAMGDATPKTPFGRLLFALQVSAGWVYFLVCVSVLNALYPM
jgi:hypothetical protein